MAQNDHTVCENAVGENLQCFTAKFESLHQAFGTSEVYIDKLLRRIGTIKNANQWGSFVLYSLYNEPNIVEDIKSRRLGWAGHIIRMEKERIPKKILNGNFFTTRPVGRPRTRWADVVQRDALQLLGIRGRSRRAENGDEWRRLYEGGQGPEGAVAPLLEWMGKFRCNSWGNKCGA